MQQVQGWLLWGCHKSHSHCLPALPLPIHRCFSKVRPHSGYGSVASRGILCQVNWVPTRILVLTFSLSCPMLFDLLWTSFSLSV